MREPTLSRVAVNGVELQLYEWPGDGPLIFLAHATSFHARIWGQVVERLPGRHAVAIDMRGHGLSDKPAPPYPWKLFGDDVTAVAKELGFEGAIAAGHSKGGHAITYAAAHAPGAFSHLLLIDPVIFDRARYGQLSGENHFASKRRNHWSSPAEMFESFHRREPFASWDQAVLRDYCDYGLVPNPAGDGCVLACPPEIEAAVYAGGVNADIYPEIDAIQIPVRVLRGRPQSAQSMTRDMTSSPTAPGLAAQFAGGEDVPLPHLSHFIPMEDPALVARHILELAE